MLISVASPVWWVTFGPQNRLVKAGAKLSLLGMLEAAAPLL